MKKTCRDAAIMAVLGWSFLILSACDNDPSAPGIGGGGAPGGVDAGAIPDAGPVAVALSESSFVLATPDLKHALTATVTGAAAMTVTWSSSDTYVATVDGNGVVTSVSGGDAIITASSTADPTKSAACTVTVAEPDRPRADDYVDARTITSGPVTIITAGDSLTRTYAANAGDQAGWGQVLDQFFTSDVTVDNTLSNGGRSSRSFYNEVGRWDQVKARLGAAKAAGTPAFVFIMFGHNDEKKTTDTDGPLYLTFASHNQNGTVAGTYFDYLERYIVETRALGGIPVIFTPFVREYLQGAPATVTAQGEHDITTPYAGETTARGDYPAAAAAVAAKHDVPLVDITAWSKTMVEAHAASGSLPFVYISSDQTHVRTLGALLMAEEAVRALNAQGILTSYARPPGARLMLDTSTISFGGIFSGNTLDRTFTISAFKDASGTITITAPPSYTLSTNDSDFASSLTIPVDSSFVGSVVSVRFTPADSIAYDGDLVVAHSSLTPDYGNTVPNAVLGAVSLTGNGKVIISGSPATATWPMFAGTTIALAPTTDGAISATPATLAGLVNKNVANGAARFDVPGGVWPAESARNEGRFIEFTVPVSAGSLTLDTISVGAGSGGGSNMRWDVMYSLADDFSAPIALGTSLSGLKDTVTSASYPSLGVSIPAGQTLHLRVYPYNTSGAASGKSIMLANVVVSAVTN